jgi:hypothetical protein
MDRHPNKTPSHKIAVVLLAVQKNCRLFSVPASNSGTKTPVTESAGSSGRCLQVPLLEPSEPWATLFGFGLERATNQTS